MEEKSIVEGKICIVKFHENKDRDNRNNLITRSLGKFGVIQTAWFENKRPDQIPKAGEFWKVRIIKEVGVGHREGCFVMHPLENVHVTEIEKLLPGMYDEEYINNILLIKPTPGLSRSGRGNWIIPLAIRKKITGVYAVIVDLIEQSGGSYERSNSLRH